MKYTGTAVVHKDFEVTADDEADARLNIIDLAEDEWPDADLYLVKDITVIYE